LILRYEDEDEDGDGDGGHEHMWTAHPLRNLTYILLGNHLLQMMFLKSFYDSEQRVNTKNKWVWVIHLISYSYITYKYYKIDPEAISVSQMAQMWIPLDIILTFNIALYQVYYHCM